ncbi:MAG TPA: DUF4330 family protein [Vicinamibacterales bacterium]|nr:DUF4330 family protein [Vicinamibacterales bacterium]
MTLVDHQGRLFSRWNVVDALVGVVLLGLIPLLYGGYVLFRPQSASLVSIEPARIQAPGDVDVTIHGVNLRPYMRVSFDGHQGRTFLFADTTKAVVRASEMPPGVYDVILYDNAQERARIAKGFEVVAAPRPQTQLEVIGAFTAMAEPLTSQIKANLQIAGLGTVTKVGKPQSSATRTAVGPLELVNVPSGSAVNIPAVIMATCALVQRGGGASCVALDNSLTRDVVLTVPLAGGNALFQIDQVRATGTPSTVDMRVRFSGEREVVERVRRGDRDIERNNEFASGAEVTSVTGVARAGASVIVTAQLPGSIPAVTAGDIATVEVVLRLPATQTVDGWSYRGQAMKPGRSFVFHGPDYEVSGTVLAIVK